MANQEFFQTAPALGNTYTQDRLLRAILAWRLPQSIFTDIEPDLRRMGKRAAGEMLSLAEDCERNPPEHIPFDPWGRRIDEIRVAPAWNTMANIAAEEGIVATGYERKQKEFSRLCQFAKLYLYSPSSAFFSCPLAMTDGAARALELYGDEELKRNVFKRLTSRDKGAFWTSGQWMTERTGGSDVGGTATIARPLGDGQYTLHGTKWFTSATTGQMAITLARIEGAAPGARGLSVFYLEIRNSNGRLNNLEIHRLKDKLGTRALPTAEISLNGTIARLVGTEGSGVKKISALFNITRIYNAVCAIAAARRALDLAIDYAKKRTAFGRVIADQPLHAAMLSDLCVEHAGSVHLTFHLAVLLGRDETGVASKEETAVLRLLTPVAKLYTAKSAMTITSECVEAFGGAGYIEDTGIPRLLRDAQVFSIWEGTTNVLSLDVLRAMERESALPPFLMDISRRLAQIKAPELRSLIDEVTAAANRIRAHAEKAATAGDDYQQASARGFAYSLARTFTASLLLEFAAADPKDMLRSETARRWIQNGLTPLADPAEDERKLYQEYFR